MSKRWKPEYCDLYYFVDAVGVVNSHTWCDDTADRTYYTIGNCFRTSEEAEAAAAMIRAMLLGFHGDQPEKYTKLPKLTADVFDRPDCPEWAKFVAVDEDGETTFFDKMPYQSTKTCGCFLRDCQYATIPSKFDPSDWKNSLIERPARLPEWCKVGEWVWDIDDSRYVKIISITDMVLLCTKGKCTYYTDLKDMKGLYSQAQIRPYNVDELKALVGKPITMSDGAVCLCTAYSKQCKSVILDNTHWNAQKLVDNGFTVDGEPCGVLEHLNEKGEWVE